MQIFLALTVSMLLSTKTAFRLLKGSRFSSSLTIWRNSRSLRPQRFCLKYSSSSEGSGSGGTTFEGGSHSTWSTLGISDFSCFWIFPAPHQFSSSFDEKKDIQKKIEKKIMFEGCLWPFKIGKSPKKGQKWYHFSQYGGFFVKNFFNKIFLTFEIK